MIRWTIKLKHVSSTYQRYIYLPEHDAWINGSSRSLQQRRGIFTDFKSNLLDSIGYDKWHWAMTIGKEPWEEVDDYLKEREEERFLMSCAEHIGLIEKPHNIWIDSDGTAWRYTRYGFVKKDEMLFRDDIINIKQVYRKEKDVR